MALGRTSVYNRPFARQSITDVLEQLSDAEVEAGQRLRDLKAWKIEQQPAGLWVARIDEIETEIQLNGRKIKDYNCDCEAFAKTECCQHFAGLVGAIHVRKQPKAPQRVPRPVKSISTKRLLDAVGDRELRDFMLDYAKKNHEFTQELKIRFAQQLPISDRFDQVIKNLLRRSTSNFAPKQAKRIKDALLRFEKQRERWIAEKAWLDVFELNTALVSRIAVIVEKSDRIQLDLSEYVRHAIRELGLILKGNPPPVIVERIEEWTEEQLDRGVYARLDLDGPLFELLLTLGNSATSVVSLIEKRNQEFGPEPIRLRTLIELYYEAGDSLSAERVLIQHLDQPDLVFTALGNEVLQENFRRAASLAQAALEEHPVGEHSDRLCLFLVQIAQQAQHVDLIPKYGPRTVRDLESLARFDEVTQGIDPQILDSVYQKVLATTNPISGQREPETRLIAELLMRTRAYQELEQLLYRTESKLVLLEFLPRLLKKIEREDLELLVETKVREVLQNNLGKKPAQFVAKLLDRLARQSRTDITSELVKRLRREFKQRHALMDALDQALL